jgi:hypothetical protein
VTSFSKLSTLIHQPSTFLLQRPAVSWSDWLDLLQRNRSPGISRIICPCYLTENLGVCPSSVKTIGLRFGNKPVAKSLVRQNNFDVVELKSKLVNWKTPLSLPRNHCMTHQPLILQQRRLLGSARLVRGAIPCVCFSEAPLTSLEHGLINDAGFSRYSPFGNTHRKRHA